MDFSKACTFKLTFIMAAAMALSPAFGQSGQPRNASPAGSPGPMGIEDVLNRLNLNAAQKQKINAIRDSARPRVRALEQQLMSKDHELQAAFQNGNFNQSLATQKLTEMAPIQAQLMGENYRVHNEIMAVLNPQQRNQLQKIEEQSRPQPPAQGSPSD